MARPDSRLVRTRMSLLVLVIAAYGGLASATGAQASGGNGSHPDGPVSQPPGYVVVSATMKDKGITNQWQWADCPKGTKVIGGGAQLSSVSLNARLTGSQPWGGAVSEWDVQLLGTSGTSTVYAICATKPTSYSSAGFEVEVQGHTYTGNLVATCHHGMPLSGGLFSPDGAPRLNSTFPVGTGWRNDVTNPYSGTSVLDSYVTCGSLLGYHVVRSAPVSNPAGQQTGATALCGTGVPVGGGVYSSSASKAMSINSSYPVPGGWRAYVNNGSKSNATLTTYVVCAS